MYENYLLNHRAIASVVSTLEGFQGSEVSMIENKVSGWIQKIKTEKRYFKSEDIDGEPPHELWIKNVDGAGVLKALFQEFSESRVEYNKINHGGSRSQSGSLKIIHRILRK
jgi:hypothetical protein